MTVTTVTVAGCTWVRVGELLSWLIDSSIPHDQRVVMGSTAMSTAPLILTVTLPESDAVVFRLRFGL